MIPMLSDGMGAEKEREKQRQKHRDTQREKDTKLKIFELNFQMVMGGQIIWKDKVKLW